MRLQMSKKAGQMVTQSLVHNNLKNDLINKSISICISVSGCT